MATKTLPLRKEIPVEHTWDAHSIFPSDVAWEKEIQSVLEHLPKISSFRGRLSEGPKVLADYFELAEKIQRNVGSSFSGGRIPLYASMFHVVDTADQAAVAKADRSRSLLAQVSATMAFALPEMLAISIEKLKQWCKEEKRLAHFEHYFDELGKRQAHLRSAEIEELLNYVSDPFRSASSTHSILSDTDLSFKPAQSSKSENVEIGQGNIAALLTSPDRNLRKTAWENYADGYLAFKNTAANCIATGVKQNVLMARVRKFASAHEAALKPNHIPLDVFHNLIKVYRKNLPTWHRYWKLRKKALGYEKLHVYDTRAPLTEKKPTVSFKQSVDWICEGMKPLGNEYVSVMRRGCLEQRWVDIYPNKGKRMGAFSSGAPDTHPFIFMSYNDDLFSMSTLAHELGHSMHSYYSRATQPFIYARYTLFLAEVASNFNQAMVRAHLLQSNSDPDFQISVIEEAMANFHRYFFIMPTLARLELEMHQRVERGEALTAESLIKLMTELFSEGYGTEVEIDHDRIGITWAQFATHLYSNFYVFQYATGISGAHALSERILKGVPGAAEKYLEFLKSGSSLYPLETLQRAGVDLSSPEPVEQTFQVLASYVDKLEKLAESRRKK
jgi:oligoendopeptidase F